MIRCVLQRDKRSHLSRGYRAKEKKVISQAKGKKRYTSNRSTNSITWLRNVLRVSVLDQSRAGEFPNETRGFQTDAFLFGRGFDKLARINRGKVVRTIEGRD